MKIHSLTRRGVPALLLAAATFAHAQMQPPVRSEGPVAGRPHERPDPLADLKARLRLQPAQEKAWAAWTAAMAPPRREPPAFPPPAATTPQRLEQMRALRQAMDAEEQRREAATLAFYAALSPEQQRVFDQVPVPPGPPERPMPPPPAR